jgi:hypothetical protein
MFLTTKEKYDGIKEPSSVKAGFCQWCQADFSPVVFESVCLACHKLLTGANLSDEEIFDVKGHKSNASD